MWIALLVTGIVYLGYWFVQRMKSKRWNTPIKVIIGLDTPPPATFFVKEAKQQEGIDFYHKATWLRVKSNDSIAVQVEIDRILAQMDRFAPSRQSVSEKWVFTTVEEWILVSSYDLPSPEEYQGSQQLEQLLQLLSSRFGEVHYFAHYQTVHYYAWAKAINGHLIRAYAYISTKEDPLWEEGRLTPEEIQLDLDFRDTGRIVEWEDNIEEEQRHTPDEHSVKLIAAAWRATSEKSTFEPEG